MPRLRNTVSGVFVNVSDETAALLDAEWEDAEAQAPADEEASQYDGLKVDELKAEIDRRNEGREEADLIPSDGKKADLIAALEADDSK